MVSMKATNIVEIFTNDLTLCGKCQIGGEDFVNFCGLLRKGELYYNEKFPCKVFDEMVRRGYRGNLFAGIDIKLTT